MKPNPDLWVYQYTEGALPSPFEPPGSECNLVPEDLNGISIYIRIQKKPQATGCFPSANRQGASGNTNKNKIGKEKSAKKYTRVSMDIFLRNTEL
jgi:hypothetical protein